MITKFVIDSILSPFDNINKNEGVISILITQKALQESLELCKFSLIARLVLSQGD